MKKRINIVKSIRKWGVISLLSLALIMIIYETFALYLDLNYRIEKRQIEYIAQQKNLVKQEVSQAVSIINLKFKNLTKIGEQEKYELLEIINQIRYGNEGYIFINKFNGDALISNGQVFAGKQKLWEIFNDNIEKTSDIFAKELKAAQNPNGDYIYYTFPRLSNLKDESPKVSFIFGIQKLQWIIGAGIYLDDIENDIALMKNELVEEIIKDLIIKILVLIVMLILFLFFSNLYFKKIKNDFNHFNAFFLKAAMNDELINLENIKFSNFEEIAKNVNSMLQAKIVAQKELRVEQELLFVTIRSVGDALITTNEFGEVQLLNKVAEKLTGWKQEEAKGKNLTEIFVIVNEASRKVVENPVYKVLTEHKIVGLANHTILISKDRTEYNISDSAAPIKDEDNNIRGVVLVFRDITKEYKILKDLQKSEERFARLSSLTYEGIMIHKSGIVLDVNPAFERITGYSIDELTDKNIIELLIPIKYHKLVLGNLNNAVVVSYEIEVIRKDGKIIPIEVESRKIEFENDYKNIRVTAFRDISRKKEREYEILKLSKAITQSPVSVVITDIDGKIEYANRKFIELTGYSLNEAIGKTPRILSSGKHDKIFYKELWETILSGKEWTGEFHNKKKSGELYWESAKISSIKNIDGKIINFIAVKEDITEKKKMIDEVIKAKEEAEKADKMKSIFLAQMSHEIRTPINALVSMSSLLRYDFEKIVTEDQKQSFNIIDRAGNRIIRTIDLLLNLSEIQAGTYEKENNKFDLYSEVLLVLVAENKKNAENKNIDLTLTNTELDTILFADYNTVNQIFVQLIDNAIKYTKVGKVAIKVYRNEEENLEVEIKDTGIGIDEKYLPNLFEPFSQEEMGYTRKYEGNGIGMALVKKYCELNNIKIEVESKKSVGTTFRVVF